MDITTTDPSLRKALAGERVTPPFDAEKLAALTSLDWSEYRAEAGLPFSAVTSLAGLQHCTGLKRLELVGNAVSNLAPLSGLTAEKA